MGAENQTLLCSPQLPFGKHSCGWLPPWDAMVPAPVVIFGPVFSLCTGRPSARLGECAGAPSHLRPGDRGQPESLAKMQVLVRALGLRRQVLSERCLRICCVAGLRTQEAGRKAKHLYSAGSFFIFDSQNICL